MKWLGVEAAVLGDEIVPGDVGVQDGRIASVGRRPAGRSGLAVPGFVDLQVNGFAGADFADAGVDDVRAAAHGLASTGVTAYQPTLTTLEESHYLAALPRLAAPGRATSQASRGTNSSAKYVSQYWLSKVPTSVPGSTSHWPNDRSSAGGVRVLNTAPDESVVSVAWIAEQGEEEAE